MSVPFKKIITEKEHGFTLIELIVVIIIVGILAAVGISQYSKMVEKGRGVEARMILGNVRQFAYQYWLENGSITAITYADLNIGSASDQIPMYPNCRNTHYFTYWFDASANPVLVVDAFRCISGGKTPQGPGPELTSLYKRITVNFSSGDTTWGGVGSY